MPEISQADPLDALIKIEWDIIHDLRSQLAQQDLSISDRIKVSNSLVYHVNALNRLLAKKGEKPANEETLGQIIAKLPKKFKDEIVRRIKKWNKKPS